MNVAYKNSGESRLGFHRNTSKKCCEIAFPVLSALDLEAFGVTCKTVEQLNTILSQNQFSLFLQKVDLVEGYDSVICIKPLYILKATWDKNLEWNLVKNAAQQSLSRKRCCISTVTEKQIFLRLQWKWGVNTLQTCKVSVFGKCWMLQCQGWGDNVLCLPLNVCLSTFPMKKMDEVVFSKCCFLFTCVHFVFSNSIAAAWVLFYH